jgi:WD40 repeat protein
MPTTSARMLALVSCLLSMSVTVIPTRAYDPPSKKSARLDAVGDPLPEGAIARLGTLRLVHRGGVAAVAVSPDGKLVASGAYDTPTLSRLADVSGKRDASDDKRAQASPRGIRLWDTRTGKLIRDLQTPEGQTSCLLFSPDGTDLYGACGSHLGCWNPHTGEQRWQKTTPDKGKLHTSLPASNLVLAGDRLVSVHSGHLNCEIRGEDGVMGTSHKQMAVRIWSRKTGALEPLPAALESTNTTGKDIPVMFHNVAVSRDGRFAAVISSYARLPWLEKKGRLNKAAVEDKNGGWQYPNPRFRIIDLGTGAVRHDFPAANLENTHVIFSDDGSLLAIAAGKELGLMEVATGGKTRVATGVPAIKNLRFMPGTRRIAAQFADQSIRVWDCKTGVAIKAHAVRNNHFHARLHSPITAISRGNAIRLLDRDSGKPLLDFEGHREPPFICFGSGPKNTLSSLDSEHFYQWEPGTWTARQHVRIQAADDDVWHYRSYYGTSGWVVSPAKGLLLKDDKKALAVHDLKTGKLVRTLESGAGKRWSSFFSQNGARAISMEDSRIVSFDVPTGKRLAAIAHPSGHPIMMAFGQWCSPAVTPTGTLFAKSDKCIDVDLIQMDTGKQLRKLSGDKGAGPGRFAILQLWFSPDERWVLAEIHRQLERNSSEESAEIAIWETERGTIVQEVMIVPRMQVWHRSSLQIRSLGALAMSSDRRLIALACCDHGDIEIWDTASATRRAVLSGHEGAITDLGFSRDGRYLASASDDTTVLVWDLNRPLHASDFNAKLAETNIEAYWRSLAERDAARADTAIWRLVKAKAPSIAFLKRHLTPQPCPDPVHVKRLLDDLDSHDFKTRSRAQAKLERFRELVLSDLKTALSEKGSLERQRRLQLLLAQAERAARPFGTPDRLREWRALEVLERIGSPGAVELLQALAAGAPNSPLTIHAAEILARMRLNRVVNQ